MMLKAMLLTLMIGCLVALSACSPQQIIVYRDKPILTPDSLLVDPCGLATAGDTVRSLASGYIYNTSCLSQYKLLLEKQREHKRKVVELYKNDNTDSK